MAHALKTNMGFPNIGAFGSAQGRGSGFLLRLQMGGVLNYVLFWITNGDKECLHFFVELFLKLL